VYGNYYYAYSSAQIPDTNHNGANTTRINNPDMDKALTSLGFDVDPAAQKTDAATVQQTVAAQNNEIPLYYRSETTGVSNHVGGWEKYNPSSVGPTWNAETWWFIP
jgi:ABC-type oligopeptide transport system substrate-binding subunit